MPIIDATRPALAIALDVGGGAGRLEGVRVAAQHLLHASICSSVAVTASSPCSVPGT